MPDESAPAPLPDNVRIFLETPRFATISTLDADGSPHQAVVWFDLDGNDLIVNSRRERHWPRNLVRDPRISVAVYEKERPNHWVGVKGRAELIHDGDAALADIMALARRYADGDPERFRGQDRVTFRIVPTSTFEYGA